MQWVDEAVTLDALVGVAKVFCFRAVPVSVWVTLRSGTLWRVRVGAGLVTAAIVAASVRWQLVPITSIAFAYGYFGLSSCCLLPLVSMLREWRASSGAVFAICAAVFLVAPGLYASPVAKVPIALLGWDLMLSGYSYCIERSKALAPVKLSELEEYLFFMLVNPVLVYTNRGCRSAERLPNVRAFGRTAVGFLEVFLASAVFVPLGAFLLRRIGPTWGGIHRGGELAGIAFAGFFAEYLRQTGVADFQTGLLRQVGYRVPERFARPLSASGPLEFWRRWNIYVGEWIQRYVFWPTSLRAGRMRSEHSTHWAMVFGVIVAFVAIGALHDAYPYLLGQRAGRGLVAFTAAGLVAIAWAGVQRWMETRDSVALSRRGLAWVAPVASRGLFWASTLALFFWWRQ